MKKIILLFVLLSLNWARAEELVAEPSLRDWRPYEALYKQIMRAEDQSERPKETQKSFKVHLQDTYSYFFSPDEIQAQRLIQPQNPNIDTYRTVVGQITYVGLFRRTYRYDVISRVSGEKIFRVKVHFKNATPDDLQLAKQKMKRAEEIWNASIWPRDFIYSFRFEVVENEKESHFSVWLKDKTRGPYDTYWSRGWGPRTYAHEVGHMLGLGDEYETLTGRSDCLESSLMCSSSRGQMMVHHYYFVLRRLVNPSKD